MADEARWLRDRRRAADLTQEQVATLSGMPVATYRRLERGLLDDVGVRALAGVALVLDCPLLQLVDEIWDGRRTRSGDPPSRERVEQAAESTRVQLKGPMVLERWERHRLRHGVPESAPLKTSRQVLAERGLPAS